jgi:putative transposase
MKKSRFTETQIVSILSKADAEMMVQEVCRNNGISPATYYKWKSKYGGLAASDLKRINDLEAENAELKRMYADTSKERDALKKFLSKNYPAARSTRSRKVSCG